MTWVWRLERCDEANNGAISGPSWSALAAHSQPLGDMRGQESISRRRSAASERVRIPLRSRSFKSLAAKRALGLEALCLIAPELAAPKASSAAEAEEALSSQETTVSVCAGVRCSKIRPIPEPIWQEVTSARNSTR